MIRHMLILLLALTCSAAFADPFSGNFVGHLDGDNYQLSMQKQGDGSYAGIIAAGGERVRLTGQLQDKWLVGTIYEEGDSYGFSASARNDGTLLFVDEDGEAVTFRPADGSAPTSSLPSADQAASGSDATPLAASGRKVYINRTALSGDTLAALERQYNVRVQAGRYWYDRVSGAWGLENGPTTGFIQSGLNLPGPMPANISGGGTNIFINGREIHPVDQRGLQALFGVTYPGRYWLDARGNLGLENGPALVNIAARIQQNQARQSGSVTHGYNSAGGARGTLGGGMYSGRSASGKSVFWYPGM